MSDARDVEEATMEGYVLQLELSFIADPREDGIIPGRKRAVSKQAAAIRAAVVDAITEQVKAHGGIYVGMDYGLLPVDLADL